MSGVNIKASLSGAVFKNTNLSGTKFEDVSLSEALKLESATFCRTTFDDENVNIDPNRDCEANSFDGRHVASND